MCKWVSIITFAPTQIIDSFCITSFPDSVKLECIFILSPVTSWIISWLKLSQRLQQMICRDQRADRQSTHHFSHNNKKTKGGAVGRESAQRCN